MTSGLPPATAERRRAGVLVPVAVPLAGWLPFFAVLLGTVLLSVMRGWPASEASLRRRTQMCGAPLGGPRYATVRTDRRVATPPGRAVTLPNTAGSRLFPHRTPSPSP